MITKTLNKRTQDDWGSGEFGASRGTRSHIGIDYCCDPGDKINAPIGGVITKLGYPYADALQFRYVEITDTNEFRHRLFYIKPTVKVGQEVRAGECVGISQDISGKYSDPNRNPMLNHMHYEILTQQGDPINPEIFWNEVI